MLDVCAQQWIPPPGMSPRALCFPNFPGCIGGYSYADAPRRLRRPEVQMSLSPSRRGIALHCVCIYSASRFSRRFHLSVLLRAVRFRDAYLFRMSNAETSIRRNHVYNRTIHNMGHLVKIWYFARAKPICDIMHILKKI